MAEVKHWHGAAPDSWFSHLAIEVPGEEACEKLYQTMNFKDITLKEIGKETSFSRTSIWWYAFVYARWILSLENNQ